MIQVAGGILLAILVLMLLPSALRALPVVVGLAAVAILVGLAYAMIANG